MSEATVGRMQREGCREKRGLGSQASLLTVEATFLWEHLGLGHSRGLMLENETQSRTKKKRKNIFLNW